MNGAAGSTGSIIAQALGIAYVSGLSVYGTVAVLGLAVRAGWVATLPGALTGWTNNWIWAISIVLYAVEFGATLSRGFAPAWETIHSLVRPPAAAILAATIAWHRDPALIVLTSLSAGALAVTTHTTKLGVRYICATTGRFRWSATENLVELAIVGIVAVMIWGHPYATLGLALVLLGAIVGRVQRIWRTLWEVFTGRWKPTSEFLQEPRLPSRRPELPK